MKILVATDGSKHGRWAIEWIARLPWLVKPTVRILHVVDMASVRAPFMVQPMVAGMERYLRAEAKRLEAAAKAARKDSTELLASLGLRGTVITDRGGVAATIVKHSRRRYGVLSIGSRGLDPLDRFMLGSVSNHAVHHASCSVLVVKQAPRSVRRIVLAVDGSSASERAVRFLLRHFRAAPGGSGRTAMSVTMVHVVPVMDYPEAGRMVAQRCAAMLSNAGWVVRSVVRIGKPAVEILKEADNRKADLIVTGAKGLGAIGRMLLGSVSTRVVHHAPCSVLVVR